MPKHTSRPAGPSLPESAIPATVVWIEHETPHQVLGSFFRQAEGLGAFVPQTTLEEPHQHAPAQSSVVICLEDAERTKLMANVQDSAGETWQLTLRKDQPILRRYYPRADASLAMAYRALDLGVEGKQMSHNQARALKSWWKPSSPVINVSNDGLSFVSTVRLPVGARMQVRLRFPDSATEHTLVGDVVRSTLEVAPPPEQTNPEAPTEAATELEAAYRIAIHLVTVQKDTRDALDKYMRLWLDEELASMRPVDLPSQA